MRLIVASLAAGLLFGAGLVISGMSDPGNVLGFLTLDHHWNPSLAFVMGGALTVTVPGFAWIHGRGHLIGGTPFVPAAHTAPRPNLARNALEKKPEKKEKP